jgi:hypothetical protein
MKDQKIASLVFTISTKTVLIKTCYYLKGMLEFDIVRIYKFQGSKELGLVVLDEEDNETLLAHCISPDDIYRRQEGIIFNLNIFAISAEISLYVYSYV